MPPKWSNLAVPIAAKLVQRRSLMVPDWIGRLASEHLWPREIACALYGEAHVPEAKSDNIVAPKRLRYSKENFHLVLNRAERARQQSRQLLATHPHLWDGSCKS